MTMAPAGNNGKPPFVVSARRILAACGSLLAAAAVALSAYAMHAADADARVRLLQAAAFAFGHGLALSALAPLAMRRTGVAALAAMLLGALLFSGSLAGAALFGLPTALAPFGGGLMILAWLAHGRDRLRG